MKNYFTNRFLRLLTIGLPALLWCIATTSAIAEEITLTPSTVTYAGTANYTNSLTSSGTPVITVTASANNMDRRQTSDYLLWHTGSAKSSTYTFSASGYVVTGYSITAQAVSDDQTVTFGDNTSHTFTSSASSTATFSKRTIPATFTLSGENSGLKITSITLQVEPLEVSAASSSLLSEFSSPNADLFLGDEAASLSVGTWYVMKNRGSSRGYLYEDPSTHGLRNVGSVTQEVKYLVRLENATDGHYYIQTAYGNYFGCLSHNTQLSTFGNAVEAYIVDKIADTDGHFYLQSAATDVVLDANNYSGASSANVVGWNTTVPTATDGNNDWAFYPVLLSVSNTDVFTINNTNASRGAMTYEPDHSEYVYSSGKTGATAFNANYVNHQWVLYSTGTYNQYYLYNIGADKFAIPTGADTGNSTASWVFSDNAVAVTLVYQSTGEFKIKVAAGTNSYAAVSNGKTGPIINYNDVGGNFTLTKVEGDASAAVTAAVNRLAESVTPLSAIPADGTSDWYFIRIKSHASFADRFVYHDGEDKTYSGNSTTYALTFDQTFNVRPAVSDALYYTRIIREGDSKYWQLADGRYLYGANNKFPIPTAEENSFSMDYSDAGIRLWADLSNTYYATPYSASNTIFIGETDQGGRAYYDLYPVNLTEAGLVAWKVQVEGSTSGKVTCTRSDVKGLTAVYNNGTFFLPTGVTPVESDFTATGLESVTIDEANHTISVKIAAILSTNVAVIQGNETTGQGNTRQALLRIKVSGAETFTPTQLTATLTGHEHMSRVALYATTNDALACDEAPTLLAETSTLSDALTLNITDAPSYVAGGTYYFYLTADIAADATEWQTLDAAVGTLSYEAFGNDATYNFGIAGNPEGEMRIYKQQTFLWTSSNATQMYYRIPTMINTADGGIIALTDYRHDHPYDLGKSATNGTGNHVIDVVARKSTDGGQTWEAPFTIAAGDGSSTSNWNYGFGDPAIVRANDDGTLHCFMAAGPTSYASGMTHIGYTKSSDNGATWTTPIDIFSSLTNPHTMSSVFVTGGKGVTFDNGRMALALLGNVSGTNIYPLYSDDNGATWTVGSSAAYTGGDESKFEIMNDGSLLLSVRSTGFSGVANRAYNRTTGDASGDGINTWGTQGTWGSEMSANGCNADILYYSRSTNGERDVLLHTLTKAYSTYRRDLRLNVSFDGGQTWKEVFQLQPGYAAYSSMQKLANGDLAIIYEDGSIGNKDHQDAYAINYIVISKEILQARIDELYEEAVENLLSPEIKVAYGMTPYYTGTSSLLTLNAQLGLEGVTLSTSTGNFDKYSDWNSHYNVAYKPHSANTPSAITISLPDGYIIRGYSFKATKASSEAHTYTIVAGENTYTPAFWNYTEVNVDNVNAQSTSFTIETTDNTWYISLADFIIYAEPTQQVPVEIQSEAGEVVSTANIRLGIPLDELADNLGLSDFSPLVTYSNPAYDLKEQKYTITYTPVNATYPAATGDTDDYTGWYYIRVRGNRFMQYNPLANTHKNYSYYNTDQYLYFGPEMQWALVGDPYNEVRIVNRKAGEAASLTRSEAGSTADQVMLHVLEDGADRFVVTRTANGFLLKLKDDAAYLNDVGGGGWNPDEKSLLYGGAGLLRTNGSTDEGSFCLFTPAWEDEALNALRDYVRYTDANGDQMSNYVGSAANEEIKYYFDNPERIGVVNGFPDEATFNTFKDEFYSLAGTTYNPNSSFYDYASQVSITTYRDFVRRMREQLVKFQDEHNYVLLNGATNRALGYAGYGLWGFEPTSNSFTQNANYLQDLSVVWTGKVDENATSLSAGNYYMPSSNLTMYSYRTNLFYDNFPLRVGFGQLDDNLESTTAIRSLNDNTVVFAEEGAIGETARFAYSSGDVRWFAIPASQYTINLTSNVLGSRSYTTFYAPFDVTIASEGTTAYILESPDQIDQDKNECYLTAYASYGDVIPKGVPVVLIDKNAATIVVRPLDVNTGAAAPTENMLGGFYNGVTKDASWYETHYTFGRSKETGLPGFYQYTGTDYSFPANRCYTNIPVGSSIRGFALVVDETVTGITLGDVLSADEDVIYDLQGHRVLQPVRGGVYIVNGKKVYLH